MGTSRRHCRLYAQHFTYWRAPPAILDRRFVNAVARFRNRSDSKLPPQHAGGLSSSHEMLDPRCLRGIEPEVETSENFEPLVRYTVTVSRGSRYVLSDKVCFHVLPLISFMFGAIAGRVCRRISGVDDERGEAPRNASKGLRRETTFDGRGLGAESVATQTGAVYPGHESRFSLAQEEKVVQFVIKSTLTPGSCETVSLLRVHSMVLVDRTVWWQHLRVFCSPSRLVGSVQFLIPLRCCQSFPIV